MSGVARAWTGAVAWAAFVFARVSNLHDAPWAHALLLFAALVLVPLALELFADPEDDATSTRKFGWAALAQLPAALLLTLACWLEPGVAAALLALPWFAFTVLLAAIGLMRMKREGMRRSLDGLCADVALGFAAIGGIWTVTDRAGYSPIGFAPAIVTLTAVHFHYAGLLLPLFAGLVQRELWFWRFASRAAVGVILGVPALAVGITATQIGWGPSLEAGTGCGLALAGMAVAVLQVRIATDGRQPLIARTLLAAAGVSLFIAMLLGAVYALRSSAIGVPWLDLPQMRMLHGTLNALGFGLCGVLGWRRAVRHRQADDARA